MIAIATSGRDGAGLDRVGQTALSGRSGSLAVGLVVVGLWLTPGFAAAGDALQVTNAQVPASDEVGIDLPLVMTIRNDATEADAIQRVRCPFANFAEKHTVDRGEQSLGYKASVSQGSEVDKRRRYCLTCSAAASHDKRQPGLAQPAKSKESN